MLGNPLFNIFLGRCLIKFLDNMSHGSEKTRYELEQIERRKQAFREQFMRENPFKNTEFPEESCMFSFGLSYEEAMKCSNSELISRWNDLHAIWILGISKLPVSETPSQETLDVIGKQWAYSNQYAYLREKAERAYLRWVDNQLILQGKI